MAQITRRRIYVIEQLWGGGKSYADPIYWDAEHNIRSRHSADRARRGILRNFPDADLRVVTFEEAGDR